MEEAQSISQGVQELIDRLHEEVVQAGRNESERLLNEAKNEARRILEDAKAEAERLLKESREKTRAEQAAATEALKLAGRDAILNIQEQLQLELEQQISKLVGTTMRDEAFLESFLFTIAEHVPNMLEQKNITLQIGSEEASKEFVAHISKKMLERGVTVSLHTGKGIYLLADERQIEVDLSVETLGALTLHYLSPHYRELFS